MDYALAPKSDPARQQAERIAAAGPYNGMLGPDRSSAAKILEERGVLPPKDATTKAPTITAPGFTPDAYAGVRLEGAPLPDDVDKAALTDGAKALGYGLQITPELAGVVAKDMALAGEVNVDQVRAWVERAGHDYDDLVKTVDDALGRASIRLSKEVGISAKDLPGWSLVQIAVQAKHQQGAKR